jgi:thioredoxin reductase
MRTIKTDVVILGGGAAGCYAALCLHKQGIKPLIICKGLVGKSGASLTSEAMRATVGSATLWITPSKNDSSQVGTGRLPARPQSPLKASPVHFFLLWITGSAPLTMELSTCPS